jgi:hypothetical protein
MCLMVISLNWCLQIQRDFIRQKRSTIFVRKGGKNCMNYNENIKGPPYKIDLPRQGSVQNLYNPALGHNMPAMEICSHDT